MKIGKYIYSYRAEHGLTMQEFADMAGLSKGYVSMLEKGRHPQNGKEIVPSIETFNKVAKAMGITIDALLAEMDPAQKVNVGTDTNDRTDPCYSAAAGEGILNDGYPTETFSAALEEDQFYFNVHGQSMEPTLQDGDIVVVAATNVVQSPDDIMLVKVNGEERTLKHVKVQEDGLYLLGENTSVYPAHFYTSREVQELPVSINGVVVRLIREL